MYIVKKLIRQLFCKHDRNTYEYIYEEFKPEMLPGDNISVLDKCSKCDKIFYD